MTLVIVSLLGLGLLLFFVWYPQQITQNKLLALFLRQISHVTVAASFRRSPPLGGTCFLSGPRLCIPLSMQSYAPPPPAGSRNIKST